jgi:hypothetical protein
VYTLTDLSGKTLEQFNNTNINFEFDGTGSSHNFRKNVESQKYIVAGPITTITINNNDNIISIVPCHTHFLDYYNNQFIKQQNQQIIASIETMFPMEVIQKKLLDHWNYANGLDSATPKWILREWCSFWLKNCLDNGYSSELYASLPAKSFVNTQELFYDLYGVLKNISNNFNLELYATPLQVKELQDNFVNAQLLHNIQNRCNSWVNTVLDNIDSPSPCITIFDEAWVQHRLRCFGYEVQCNGLDQLPTNAKDLAKLIYKNA